MTTQGAITIYNKRAGDDRRDVYVPTLIGAASYSEALGSERSKGDTEERLQYKLRIPLGAEIQDGRRYVPEQVYKSAKDVSGMWTIGQLDLVTRGEPVVSVPATEREIRESANAAGLAVIVVKEYADNTGRGSRNVRHWRILGR